MVILLRSIGELSNPKVENLCVQGESELISVSPQNDLPCLTVRGGYRREARPGFLARFCKCPGGCLQTLYRASKRWSVSSRLVVLRLLLLKSCCKLCHREEAGWFVPLPKFSPSRRWLCTFCKSPFHRSSGGKALGFWEMETAEVYLSLTWAI